MGAAVMIEAQEFEVIVDTRPAADYEQLHVKGAVLMSKTNLAGCEQRRVGFYCSVGAASEAAAARYASTGGESAYAIGTIDGLAAAGVPTESGMPESHAVECATQAQSQESSLLYLWIVLAVAGAVAVFGLAAYCTVRSWRGQPSASSKDVACGEKRPQLSKEIPPA